ncbi:hypothetical protein GYA44_00675 [Candidatus Microgenomates bacterium]|jgi:hypothetical protein|nr:hypothetical protein [Candidatus Microgenomates bacterium]
MVKFLKRYYRTVILISLIVFVIASNFFIYRFASDAIVILLIIVAIIFKKEREFFREWSIPILLFYFYEYIRGRGYILAEFFGRPLLTDWLVNLENRIFDIGGDIPNVFLQYNLSTVQSGVFSPNWYDYVLFFFYISFFWFWLGVGCVIWVKRRKMFNRYIYGLIGLSLVSSLIYILYPSAPPWYASELGILPPLQRLMLSYDFFSTKYFAIVSTYESNYFAAFPSLHAGWPMYASLFAIGVFGKKAIPLLIVPLVIAFATWYGAEHYIIDSIFGFLLAGIAYVVATKTEAKKSIWFWG